MGSKINGIFVRLANETMQAFVHLHARILVIVKWADCHALMAGLNVVHLCRLSGGQVLFDYFKYSVRAFSRGSRDDELFSVRL